MNQFEVHSVQRVALNAAQTRRFGAAESLHNAETCDAPERKTNQLPVNSPGEIQLQPSEVRESRLFETGGSLEDPCAVSAPGAPWMHALL